MMRGQSLVAANFGISTQALGPYAGVWRRAGPCAATPGAIDTHTALLYGPTRPVGRCRRLLFDISVERAPAATTGSR